MAVVARFEVEDTIKQALFGSAVTVEQVIAALCPGMTVLPPRKENGTWVFEATMPDDIIREDKQGKIILLSMKEVSDSKYNYDIERRFKIV